MNYQIDCLFDSEFYENLRAIKKQSFYTYRKSLLKNNYIYNLYTGGRVHKNYILFILKIGDCIIRKIQLWWKKIYYSPHTKVGKKRFDKSFDKLYNIEVSDTKEENIKETDVITLVNPKSKNLKTTTQSKRNLLKHGYFLYQKSRDKIILKFHTNYLFNYFLEEYTYTFNKSILKSNKGIS